MKRDTEGTESQTEDAENLSYSVPSGSISVLSGSRCRPHAFVKS